MSAVLTDSTWERDEAIDTESDEAFDGEDAGEDFGEDFGEATRRRSRGRGGRSAYRPARGVKGLSLRNQDGQVRNVAFPKKLATVEETNKGLATQDAARRALGDRLERLEGRFKNVSKRDAAIIGTITLGIGLPLTLVGGFQAFNSPQNGSAFRTWADLRKTDAVAVTSATQLLTTTAKYALDSRYHHSRIGVAADIFAILQLGAYAIGHIPQTTQNRLTQDETRLTADEGQTASIQATLNTLNASINTMNASIGALQTRLTNADL